VSDTAEASLKKLEAYFTGTRGRSQVETKVAGTGIYPGRKMI
jgi:hypothetical protein